jgi:hypothetical protein
MLPSASVVTASTVVPNALSEGVYKDASSKVVPMFVVTFAAAGDAGKSGSMSVVAMSAAKTLTTFLKHVVVDRFIGCYLCFV